MKGCAETGRRSILVFLAWVGTIVFGLSALYELFNIFTSAIPTGYGSIALGVVSFVMTFVTRYAIGNTESR